MKRTLLAFSLAAVFVTSSCSSRTSHHLATPAPVQYAPIVPVTPYQYNYPVGYGYVYIVPYFPVAPVVGPTGYTTAFPAIR